MSRKGRRQMEKRTLGKTGWPVAPVGLGCMGFSHAYGTAVDRKEAVNTIRAAVEMGYDFFDTAECYTGVNADGSTSYNEEIVGEALRPVRDQVILASKFGVTHAGDHLVMDSRPETIRKSVEGSLKRLGVEVIDLYYQHRIDPNVPPEVVAETMAELIQEGKIRSWGISETTEDYLRRAHAVCPVTAIQNRYSMMARWYENLFPVVEELGITYVAFSPLANGILTGAYTADSKFAQGDFRNDMPQYQPEAEENNRRLLDQLQRLAAEKNATPSQISLAWMLCKKPYILPIPGSRKIERLRENLAAGEITLSKEEIQTIDRLLDGMKFEVFGGHSAAKS